MSKKKNSVRICRDGVRGHASLRSFCGFVLAVLMLGGVTPVDASDAIRMIRGVTAQPATTQVAPR